MRFYIIGCQYSGLGLHSVKFVFVLKYLPDFISEDVAHLVSPASLLRGIVAPIKRHDVKEVYIVMGNQERITVKQPVSELL